MSINKIQKRSPSDIREKDDFKRKLNIKSNKPTTQRTQSDRLAVKSVINKKGTHEIKIKNKNQNDTLT